MVFWQISLVETPERGRKKLMSLTTNVMRDDSDKVKDSLFLYSSCHASSCLYGTKSSKVYRFDC